MSKRIEVQAQWHSVRFLNCELPLPPLGSGVEKTGLVRDWVEYLELVTGVWSGPIGVTVECRPSRPEAVEASWEDVAEFSVIVDDGPLVLCGIWEKPMPDWPRLDGFGPGTYRVRVHARGRDVAYDGAVSEATEEYLLVSWLEKESPPSLISQVSQVGKGVILSEEKVRSMLDGASGHLTPARPVPIGPPSPPLHAVIRYDKEEGTDSTNGH
ncbi:hypothetical protein ACX3O0_06995 [Homoserinimonas sp. A447]